MRHPASMLRLAGWAVVAALGLLALVRAVAPGLRFPPVLGLFGLGALPYLSVLPVAVAALARHHLRLGVVALSVAAAAIPTGLPEVTARRAVPAAATDAPRLRILSWNVFFGNTDLAAIDRVIRQADADIVVLQEVSAGNFGSLQRSPALAAYRHGFISPQLSDSGSGIWSRLPLDGAEEFDVGGLLMARAVVLTPSGPVRLVNVHALSPLSGSEVWAAQLRRLGQEVQRPGPPTVLAGDFNATWGHQPFRRLLAAGADDAAAALGRPWSPTWPVGARLVPPALRIDHVLTGPGLVATGYAVGPAGGSDHRSIVVDIAILPPPPP